ncbi:LytTR family DNA-binding domain-containing protein [Tenacibaculum ovolyticum]|uniref:LytTR family DNA-binding domain-containing protein n=1 Tax=Tenacibaculum ovolyticum TaxID=104270 RepID=UPI00048BB499|nr:LytTR family DNA-binding domain-containing protein [Tenacibaculum ovolyticum]
MQKEIQYSILRNPLYVLGCYSILLLPSFINSCSSKTVVSSFWNNIPSCSKEFVFVKFLGNSIWSIVLLIVVFESFKIACKYLKISSFPVKIKEWLKFESKLITSSLVAFFCYLFLAYLFSIFNKSIEDIDVLNIFYKAMLVAFVGIHGVLLISYFKYKKNPLNQKIAVKSSIGNIPILVNEIIWFEKVDRNYFVNSKDAVFKIDYNLAELDQMLSEKYFFRINRAVIVNIAMVKNITRWENEKYIVELTNKKDFVVTRKRVVELRGLIENLQKNK